MCLSVRITHLQWQSPLILMYAVMNDMHVLYVIYFMCVLFVCLYIAAHCRTPECKSVRPDWSFRPLLRFYSMSTTLWSYSMSTTPWSYSMRCTTQRSMSIVNNTVMLKYFYILVSAPLLNIQWELILHSLLNANSGQYCTFYTLVSTQCTVLLLLKANTVEHF